MYQIVLAAHHLTQSPRKRSEQAFYEEFGTVPFAGLINTIRVTDRLLRQLRALRARPFGSREKASVL